MTRPGVGVGDGDGRPVVEGGGQLAEVQPAGGALTEPHHHSGLLRGVGLQLLG